MQIRTLKHQDRQAVLDMMVVFYASDALLIHPDKKVLEKTLYDCLADSPYLDGFVMELEGKLIGYAMAAKSYSTEVGGPCVWLEDIYLLPSYRGKGYGTAFLRFFEDHYKDAAIRLRLEAEPENHRAMAAYEKAGYRVLGYTQMVKELTHSGKEG